MDFSAVCLDAMVGNPGHLKHLRSASETDLDSHDWRSSSVKMTRTESYVPGLVRAAGGAADVNLPFYNHGGGGGGAYHCAAKSTGLAVARIGPFTAAQWQELEHQALIFRYMMAGVVVPPELVAAIRKTNPMNVNLFAAGSLRPSLGWSSFHLGFGGGNADPEPGRCRRTDGKKWRCSRDAVPDQKYCERHMNRGRHRSRKPVEGQTQPPPTTAAATTTSTAATSLAARSAAYPKGNTSSFSNLRPSQPNPSPYAAAAAATPFQQIPLNVDRYLLKDDLPGQMFESPSSFDGGAWRPSRAGAPSKAAAILVDEAPVFGLGHRDGGGVRHFFDDWPPRSVAAAAATQLSISIPSSPNEKLTLSPLKLSTSRSNDPLGVDVALGVGVGLGVEPLHRHRQTQNNWIPIAWESPVGGPLAEVLNSAAPLPHEKSSNNSSSVLNLMTGDAAWDCSPRGGASPTGVLQKTLCSLSDNSSTGSSPRAPPVASLCENLRTAAFAQLSGT